MIALDEDALICDFAETYHVLDYRTLPPVLAATLAIGLDENARIKMRINGVERGELSIILSAIMDGVNTLIWMQSKDGQRGRNRPKSLSQAFIGKGEEREHVVAESGEAFHAMRMEILNGN